MRMLITESTDAILERDIFFLNFLIISHLDYWDTDVSFAAPCVENEIKQIDVQIIILYENSKKSQRSI